MNDSEKVLAARERLGCVYECACGTIHLSVGPVDLKFNRESFLETLELMRAAATKLGRHVSGEDGVLKPQVGLDELDWRTN
jgi:hypothetical protein